MKLEIKAEVLLAGLKAVKGAIEKRTTIPILSNVLLRADANGTLSLRGTDLDIEISFTVDASVSEAGTITVDADKFMAFVGKLTKLAPVKLESDEKSVKISSGRSRATLNTLPATEFPDLLTGDLPHHFSMSTEDVRKLFGRAQFAMSSEETRYYLNGIYLHPSLAEDGKTTTLRAVATDGHRLARVDIPLPDGAGKVDGVIVPRKTVGEVLRLCDGDDSVEVSVSTQKIMFKTKGATIVSKLIDGTFPDYARVIPVSNNKVAIVGLSEFSSCADRMGTMTTPEKGRATKLSFSNGPLLVAVSNPDAGSATEDIDAEYSAGALDIGFNIRYLLDILNEFSGDKISIAMADGGAPALITSPGDESVLAVIMPMRV